MLQVATRMGSSASRHMTSEFGEKKKTNWHGEHLAWAIDEWLGIPDRCRRQCIFFVSRQETLLYELEHLRDTAMDTERYGVAIPCYGRCIPQSSFATKYTYRAKQGIHGNRVLGTGSIWCKPSILFFRYGSQSCCRIIIG